VIDMPCGLVSGHGPGRFVQRQYPVDWWGLREMVRGSNSAFIQTVLNDIFVVFRFQTT
jgi:hypothetical protein